MGVNYFQLLLIDVTFYMIKNWTFNVIINKMKKKEYNRDR